MHGDRREAVEPWATKRSGLLLARTQLDPVETRGQGELRARRTVSGCSAVQRENQGRNRRIWNQRYLEGKVFQEKRFGGRR